jgi:Domain of unknown function (DUF4129)
MIASRIFIVLLLALTASVTCVAEAGNSAMTPEQYGAELDRLLAATEQLGETGPPISELPKELPRAWQVETRGMKFAISTDRLARDLRRLHQRFDPELQKSIGEQLRGLRADLAAYEKAPSDISRQRAILAGIVARREFHDLHGPSWGERLKQRLVQALLFFLRRFLPRSVIPTVGRILVYSLLGIAILVLALWLYRSLRRGAATERVVPPVLPVSAKEWTVWMSEAREAALRGNWRDAIHLSYWAGISFLEVAGMWRPDRARTPREYLRLLPSSSEYQPALTALTRDFEVVWYGKQEADAQAFSRALERLEQLGCR